MPLGDVLSNMFSPIAKKFAQRADAGAMSGLDSQVFDTSAKKIFGTDEFIPPDNQFQTVKGIVDSIMPADNSGLPHQRFVLRQTTPDAGQMLEVDNDTHYGSLVPNLKVGDSLTIKGVEYHDPNKDGIHWTHHANVPGDAGFIQTADGHVYQ
ncbi:MAG TPA: DUF3465 domain-containing protein [Oscillatoriaceae cyanobacterium]